MLMDKVTFQTYEEYSVPEPTLPNLRPAPLTFLQRARALPLPSFSFQRRSRTRIPSFHPRSSEPRRVASSSERLLIVFGFDRSSVERLYDFLAQELMRISRSSSDERFQNYLKEAKYLSGLFIRTSLSMEPVRN